LLPALLPLPPFAPPVAPVPPVPPVVRLIWTGLLVVGVEIDGDDLLDRGVVGMTSFTGAGAAERRAAMATMAAMGAGQSENEAQ